MFIHQALKGRNITPLWGLMNILCTSTQGAALGYYISLLRSLEIEVALI
ncbi:MAG: hypothetical protein QOH63_1020 [Acidobacteriota bacterium]|jgi:hypothetical protein|nr:hypothetical protein [Acidobacteriota bacterium]